MELYTDKNPNTTLKGLGYRNELIAKKSINMIETYFNKMLKKQKPNTYTPNNVKPRIFINNKKENFNYYQKQKMYRVLGLLNRAKGMIHRITNNIDMIQAIKIFELWMKKYKKINDKCE
jgi:hypothetical protein